MYLRFTVAERHPDSHSPKGVFAAAGDLEDSDELEEYELMWLREILDWFNSHLEIPDGLGRPVNRRAVCWFHHQAGEPLRKIWELVSFLEVRGVPVRLHRTAELGAVIYRDKHQVAAFPRRRRR